MAKKQADGQHQQGHVGQVEQQQGGDQARRHLTIGGIADDLDELLADEDEQQHE